MRSLVRLLAAVGLLSLSAFTCVQAAPADDFQALADTFYAEYFAQHPEWATQLYLDDFPHNTLSNRSPASLLAWEAQSDQWLAQLRAIDKLALTRQEDITAYESLEDYLLRAQGVRICRQPLWDLGPFGWQTMLALLAEKQPVGTPAHRQAALERAHAIPPFIAQEKENLRLGVILGYTAPATILPRIIGQFDQLLALPPEQSPLFVPGTRDEDSGFRQAYAEVLRTEIYPAMQNFREFLAGEYAQAARQSIGVGDLPNGEMCYNAMVRWHVTQPIPAQTIHAQGYALMDRLEEELKVISARSFDDQPMLSLLKHLRGEAYALPSEQAILDYNLAALARAREASPALFNKMPRADIRIEPYPLYRAAAGAPGEYHPPSPDGLTPGTFLINTFKPSENSRTDMESTLFHEAIPGHHYQIALSLETPNLHPVSVHVTLDGNSGYIEGWALYAERLAQEMDLFSDDVSRAGFISNNTLRAARMVVDPGLHVLGWTKDQALEYLMAHSSMDDEILAGEIDRYIAYPGQATAYSLGMLEIMRLREMAHEAFGEDFDIKAFHDEVLQYGTLPLSVLTQRIEDWIDQSA